MKTMLGLMGAAFALAIAAAGCTKPAEAPGGNADEVAEGAPLYEVHCAKCHGPGGGGTSKGPKLVGFDALPVNPPPRAKMRTGQFHTAADVLSFVEKYMPADKPGSLSEKQYSSILAFTLKANGIDMEHERLNNASAGDFVLHPEAP